MEPFLRILGQPDNLPIVAMVVAVFWLLWLWLRQAVRYDRLVREGRRDEVLREMRR